jgi:hypothetical protein
VAISRGMRRLLGVLEAQEERYRAEMEMALAELQRLQRALELAAEREQAGRRLVWESAFSNQLTERLAGLEEARAGQRHAESLRPMIADAVAKARACRQEFLNKRIERRQAEIVVERAAAVEATEAGRRGQRGLDDWFLGKMRKPQNVHRER